MRKAFILLVFLSLFVLSARASDPLLITETSVGAIKLKMTLGEAKAVLPKGWKFGPAPGDEGMTLVGVYEGEKLLLEIGYYEGDAGDDKLPPINEDQKITGIGIIDSRFKTADGVHPGMSIADAEKKLGKLKEMFNYPHGGELGSFSNQPKYMNFSFKPKGEGNTAGIYKPVSNCPTPDYPPSCSKAIQYNPGSYISAIGIQVPPPAQRIDTIKGLPGNLKITIYGPAEGDCTEDDAETGYALRTTIGDATYQQYFGFKGLRSCPDEGDKFVESEIAYKDQFDVSIGDFNFDGFTDIALRDGMNGGYGAPSYQVYLFDTTANEYLLNQEMTDLAQFQGMFNVIKDEKLIQVRSKSSCCTFLDERYVVKDNKPIKVYEKTTDYTAPGADENNPVITIKRLVDGKWVTEKQ